MLGTSRGFIRHKGALIAFEKKWALDRGNSRNRTKRADNIAMIIMLLPVVHLIVCNRPTGKINSCAGILCNG